MLEILNKGEVQVGDKERTHQLEGLKKEVATLVAEMCIDPSSQKPIPVTMIEKAMAQVHFGAQSNKSAKSQVPPFFYLPSFWVLQHLLIICASYY